jgi:hypothetical protein
MRFLVAILSLLFVAGHARADAARDALAEIVKCTEIADASERLKCFDAAAPRARSALTAPAQPVPEKRGTPDSFGLPSPSKPVQKAEDFGKPTPPPGPEEITSITATVVEFAKTLRGKSIFILDNGQVWRQLDSDGTEVGYPPPGATMKVTIETGVLGSYNLTMDGRNGLVKVRRLQ